METRRVKIEEKSLWIFYKEMLSIVLTWLDWLMSLLMFQEFCEVASKPLYLKAIHGVAGCSYYKN
jgi:hypothetical protein